MPGQDAVTGIAEENMDNEMTVCGETYRIIRLLGHGKGGYSYLAEKDGRQTVLKQIHPRRNAGTMNGCGRPGSGFRR